jgi:predicted MFS family arabinose efflux permease
VYSRRFKVGYLAIEGLNSFSTVYYFYYFYFYMQKVYGFDNKANLTLAALNGGTYAVFAWGAGKFAQRFGYFSALKIGFATMIGALAAGAFASSASMQILLMLVTVIGMCFTWPALEAMVAEGEDRAGVQRMVGVYNVVWAATAALAYFTGGAMLDNFGLRTMFFVPIAVLLVQLGMTLWLEQQARASSSAGAKAAGASEWESKALPEAHSEAATVDRAAAKRFLRISVLANPFAYIAIQTLIAAMPGVAQRLELSTTAAGFCASVWCFSRGAAFLALMLWTGWHYRFGCLLLAYISLVLTFAAILLAPNLAVLVVAQLVFGVAVGLLYYSSLFYSMDQSDTKGEHGGIHEAAIGLGNCAGPAVGAAALEFLPAYANSGTIAVTVLLLCGLAGLGAVWKNGRVG